MLVPLISSGNPEIGEIIFKLEQRSINFEMPLGHASGDFFMQMECEVCLTGESWGMKVNVWETSG